MQHKQLVTAQYASASTCGGLPSSVCTAANAAKDRAWTPRSTTRDARLQAVQQPAAGKQGCCTQQNRCCHGHTATEASFQMTQHSQVACPSITHTHTPHPGSLVAAHGAGTWDAVARSIRVPGMQGCILGPVLRVLVGAAWYRALKLACRILCTRPACSCVGTR